MFCHNCGNQIPDGSKFCRICGAVQELPQSAAQRAPQSAAAAAPPVQPAQQAAVPPAPAQQTPYAAPPPAAAANRSPDSPPPAPKTKKTPLWVRLLFIALAVLIGRGLGQLFAASYNASGASGGSSSSGYTSRYQSSSGTGGTSYSTGGGTNYASDSSVYVPDGGMLGDYYVYIRAADTYVSAKGETLLIVTFDFTNNSEETCNFNVEVKIDISQDGQPLSEGVLSPFAERAMYEEVFGDLADPSGLPYTSVAPGTSLQVKKVFNLYNTTSDVLVEVSPKGWISSEQGEKPVLRKIFMF